MVGSLVYEDYKNLIRSKRISLKKKNFDQIQPSSIDLSLSNECYEIKYSFLPPKSLVREKLKKLTLKKINLDKKYVFKINKTYLVKLNENLNLSNNILGHCNPKSSTGRLDIFCRTIVDYAEEYEKIPLNYKGELFIEITPRSFNIQLKEGDKLNQLRLAYLKHNYLNDKKLNKLNSDTKILINYNIKNKINNGLILSVDLSKSNSIIAYEAKIDCPIIKFNNINYHDIKKYWKAIKFDKNNLIIKKNKFYILKSKEKIVIPSGYAGEMVPYDTGIGDFRVHYAGFFDPGFGNPNGSFAVLEVKTNEVPFILEDGQTIARIRYEKLNKNSKIVYGSKINSSYQNQELNLSKHFRMK